MPDHILAAPRPLDANEHVQVEAHAALGADIAGDPGWRATVVVRHRTGRWDGTGYPDRPAGEDTPPGARIPAPADAFDVMVSMRTDKAARSREDAPEEAARCAGGQFDPDDVRTVRRLWTAGSALARAAARLGLTPARGRGSSARRAGLQKHGRRPISTGARRSSSSAVTALQARFPARLTDGMRSPVPTGPGPTPHPSPSPGSAAKVLADAISIDRGRDAWVSSTT